MLLEGPCGGGKTSLALECAHRLPAARWISCWPQKDHLDASGTLPLFVDHIECLKRPEEWLAWCAQQLYETGIVAISDRRLRLPEGARVQRLLLDERARVSDLPEQCQLLSLPLPPQLLTQLDWVRQLDDRFLLREQAGWLSLHPDLATRPSPDQSKQALKMLQTVEQTPIWAEVVFQHLRALGDWAGALELFRSHHSILQQRGEFQRIIRMTGALLDHDPRLGLAHFAQAEARAALGQLEQALADLDNVLLWADPGLRLRALASRCHLRLDLGQPQAAAEDAQASLELSDKLGGRQPARIKACNGLARVHNLRGQAREGEIWGRRALELAQACGDAKGEAYSFFILGQSLAEQELWQDSLSQCQSGFQLARQQGEVRLTLIARYWMGAALLQLGRSAWAEELLEQSHGEARLFGDLKMLALGELMMAQLRLAQNRKDCAHQHLSAAEELVKRCGYPLLAIRSLLLKQSLQAEPEWGERARLLAEQVGLVLPGARSLEVWSGGQCRRLPEAAVTALRAAREEFDLWIDLEQNTAWVRTRGPLQLLSKKIPTRILLSLMRQPGRAHSAEALFAAGWDHPFEGESSAAQVRKNVARLRNLLGAETILVRDHSFAHGGGYYFNEAVSYCLIQA